MNNNARDTFVNGALWLTASAIIMKIIGLIYKIPISYLLGDEGMGIFNSAYTVYTLFYIIGSAGVPKAISILVSKYEAEREGSSGVIFRTAFFSVGALGIILTVLFFAFSNVFSSFIGNSSSYVSMLAISPSILFVTLSGVLRGYFVGKTRFSVIAISELIAGILKLLLGILFAYIGVKCDFSLSNICALTILGITVGSFFSFLFLYISIKKSFFFEIGVNISLKCCKEIFSLAAPLTLSAVLGSAVNVIDLSMLMNGLLRSGYSSAVATAMYGNYTTLAVPMLGLVSALTTPITTSMQPLLTENFALKNKSGENDVIFSSFELISFISLPSFVGFMFFSKEILAVIFEYESAVIAAPMLSLLAPAVLLLGVLSIMNTTLESMGNVTLPMISLGGGAIVKMLLGGYFTYKTDLGILSAPLGSVASYLFSLCVSSVAFLNHKKIDNSVFFVGVKYLFFSILAASLGLILKFVYNVDFVSRVQNIIFVTVYGALYLLFSLIFSKNIRKNALKIVNMHKKVDA